MTAHQYVQLERQKQMTENEPDISGSPILFPTSIIFNWLNEHFGEVREEAKHRNMPVSEFLVLMLDDTLDAYQNGRGEENIRFDPAV